MATEYSYLVIAANEMYKLHLNPQMNIPGYVAAATLGCNTLRELIHDEAFFADIAMLCNIRKTNTAEYTNLLTNTYSTDITENFNQFKIFLNAERRILTAGGMDEGLAEMLFGEINQELTAIQNEPLDVDEIRLKVATLRRKACKFADSLRYEHRPSYVRPNISKLVIAVGGAAIVGLNASSLVATIGLSAPAAAVSNAIGCTLIGIGATVVIDDGNY